MDYNRLQREAAEREVGETVLPMLRRDFPDMLARVSIALTGSGCFGAADAFSDFDGTVFLLDDDFAEWGEGISRALAGLPAGRWAEVQDPRTEFSALSYGRMGLPLSSKSTGTPTYDAVSPHSAWHFRRYLLLYDGGGHLQKARSIASEYPREVARLRSRHHLACAAVALGDWDSAQGPLSRWSITSGILCDVMRGALLNMGELYPHEKWLWWWFSRQQYAAIEPLQYGARAVAREGPEASEPLKTIRHLLEHRDNAATATDRPGQGQAWSPQAVWRDLWWQDNCLYHDIMRDDPVSAFIRTGRCLERIVSLCSAFLGDSAKKAPVPLEDLKRCSPPVESIGRHLECLSTVAEHSKWRYQVGYVIEILRDALTEKGLISRQAALKPWIPGK